MQWYYLCYTKVPISRYYNIVAYYMHDIIPSICTILYYRYARTTYGGKKALNIIIVVVHIIIIYYYRIIRPHQVLWLTNNTYAQWTRNRPRLCVLMCKYTPRRNIILLARPRIGGGEKKASFYPQHINNILSTL